MLNRLAVRPGLFGLIAHAVGLRFGSRWCRLFSSRLFWFIREWSACCGLRFGLIAWVVGFDKPVVLEQSGFREDRKST
jgi:hypothetical protein